MPLVRKLAMTIIQACSPPSGMRSAGVSLVAAVSTSIFSLLEESMSWTGWIDPHNFPYSPSKVKVKVEEESRAEERCVPARSRRVLNAGSRSVSMMYCLFARGSTPSFSEPPTRTFLPSFENFSSASSAESVRHLPPGFLLFSLWLVPPCPCLSV